jgi:hypothetical protein
MMTIFIAHLAQYMVLVPKLRSSKASQKHHKPKKQNNSSTIRMEVNIIIKIMRRNQLTIVKLVNGKSILKVTPSVIHNTATTATTATSPKEIPVEATMTPTTSTNWPNNNFWLMKWLIKATTKKPLV